MRKQVVRNESLLGLLLLILSFVGLLGSALGMQTVQMASPFRCIVTGGSSGIGEAICHELGKRGHTVFVTGRSVEALERVSKGVKAAGGQSAYGVGDVSKEQDVKRLFEEANAFFKSEKPGCDLLIASAGIGRFGLIEDMSETDFDDSYNTNVKGVWLWARQVLPSMKESAFGQVIFVSSIAGLRNLARCSIYGSTKWAVQGIAGSLREECRGTGVKVATLCPGSVATPWWQEKVRGGKDSPPSQEQLDKMLKPEDVAKAAMAIVDQGTSADIEKLVLDPPLV